MSQSLLITSDCHILVKHLGRPPLWPETIISVHVNSERFVVLTGQLKADRESKKY